MDLNSIRYFVELAKTLHFTKAAQNLYITQQNLSQHIKKLENYLCTPLFYRKPQLTLTPAGEEFYNSALKLIAEEDDILRRINDISENNIGTLNVGINQYRGQFCIPAILPSYMESWPNVSVTLTHATSSEMEQMLFSGELDLFIGIKQSDDSMLNSTLLLKDKIYLALSKDLLYQFFGEKSALVIKECINGTTLDRFKNFPFILLKSNNRLRNQVDMCFTAAGFAPKIVLEAFSIDLTMSLLKYNIGAFFCTEMKVPSLKETYPNILFFPLLYDNEYVSSPLCLVSHKNRYFPRHAHDFVERMKTYFESLHHLS